ncbi:MAG: nucleotidyltransferase domain-containing protein [Thermoplasmata archaeon]|nr:nucleotidyltransferase domain-containing protein [Thermoplasmata archaeon]
MGETRECTFEELCDIIAELAPAYGMKRMYLFGPRARGDSRPDSDYDFFAVPGDDCSLFTASGFLLKLQNALGDVDPVLDDPGERNGFADRMDRDLRLVYES